MLSLLTCAIGLTVVFAVRPPMGETESRLREQAKLHADSFEANQRLGEYYIHKHQLAAGIPYLEKAYKLDPSSYVNAYDLALAYLEAGETNRARQTVQQLLQHQDRGELHNLLGDVEEAAGNIQEAAKEYEAAARMDPSEKNLFDLGTDLLQHKALEPALQVFTYAVTKYPRSAKLHVGLGVVDYSLRQYDNAVKALCQSVDLDPKDTRALDFLGKMYDVSPGLADEVTKRLKKFVEIYPDSAPANYYYALSLRKRNLSSNSNETDRLAETLLSKAITLDPKFSDAHYQLGLLYEDEGLASKAIREYEAATRLRSDFKDAHYRLARLYSKTGQRELARREYGTVKALSNQQQ